MDWSNCTDVMNIFTPAMVVSDLIIPLFFLVLGAIGTTVAFKIKERNKKLNAVKSLLVEIGINQTRLLPLAECVDKVLDNDNNEYSEIDSTPNKLHFEKNIYESVSNSIDLFDYDTIYKVIKYYSETQDIEEGYNKLEVIRSASHGILYHLINCSELHEYHGESITPSLKEIIDFFRHTKQVYDLGEELIHDLEK